jgi:hypothetical protein
MFSQIRQFYNYVNRFLQCFYLNLLKTMPSSFNKAKSNHMIEYYRKQSDKKMVQSIIHMKSELS